MSNEIEKSEQPSHEDVLAAITSFNDPTIITNMFRELGWTYSIEIKETLTLAKQNANLSIKFKAIKHLRELLREAAETSGYTARVSQTIPDANGGTTTFSAKRIANILNPTKQIESSIKESQNDKKETQTKPDRGCDRGQSQKEGAYKISSDECRTDSAEPIRDSRRAFPLGDTDSGGTESQDGGETSREVAGAGAENDLRPDDQKGDDRDPGNPCVQTRPPTCDQDLFPGISSGGD